MLHQPDISLVSDRCARCGLNRSKAPHKVRFKGTDAVPVRNAGVKGANFAVAWPFPSFTLRPRYGKGQVLHFTVETETLKKDPRRCLGRSRGGSGTKIHAVTNQNGLPIRYELTPGQAHDAPPCKTLLDNLQPGQHVLADKAYDADWIRALIWEQGAIDVIPPKTNRKLPAEFDAEIYRERNKIERFFGRLKASFRRIAIRYEKTSRNYLSMIKLASVRLWIEFYESAA